MTIFKGSKIPTENPPKDFIFLAAQPLLPPPIPKYALEDKPKKKAFSIAAEPIIQGEGKYIELQAGELACPGDEGWYQGCWSPVMNQWRVEPGERVRRFIRPIGQSSQSHRSPSYLYLKPRDMAQIGDEIRLTIEGKTHWAKITSPVRVYSYNSYRRFVH